MSEVDFNLLLTLNAVLSEGSVVRAARRLNLSPSAMSRALARVREVTGDPLLVRAGRGLVPTPRAAELRERVARAVQEAEEILRPAVAPDLSRVHRVFVLRTSEGFVENFGSTLIARVREQAPDIRLSFIQKPNKDSAPLRDGSVDLETGVIEGTTGPEVRARALFEDRFVGVVRPAHALAAGDMNSARYAAAEHVAISRRGITRGLIDQALAVSGLERRIAASVSGFATALALVRDTDFVATVPEVHTARLREGLHTFPLPFEVPPITVSLLWHPRMHADPVHRWLRELTVEVCGATVSPR